MQRSMLFSDYLREQAEKYRKLAEATEDPTAKKEFLELAAVSETARRAYLCSSGTGIIGGSTSVLTLGAPDVLFT